jgi:hypothetical protein
MDGLSSIFQLYHIRLGIVDSYLYLFSIRIVVTIEGLGLTIFQLYHGCQFYWWGNQI